MQKSKQMNPQAAFGVLAQIADRAMRCPTPDSVPRPARGQVQVILANVLECQFVRRLLKEEAEVLETARM
jgi:hypothetical protein